VTTVYFSNRAVDRTRGQPLERSTADVRDWEKAGAFRRIFDAGSGDSDLEFAVVHATIVKVHRHTRAQLGD
jgi:hypothetical protein